MQKIGSTLGFLFTPDFKKVLLIKKQKPAFQKGKLNGLGGKIEAGESVKDCIVREVEEESGLKTQKADWHQVGTLQWQEWDVVLFAGLYQGKSSDLKNPVEEVEWYKPDLLPENSISNITWMIPLCIDVLRSSKELKVTIIYSIKN